MFELNHDPLIRVQRVWLHRNQLNAKVVSMKLDDGTIVNFAGVSKLFAQRTFAKRIFEKTGKMMSKLRPCDWDRLAVKIVNELKFGNEE